jgi:hypothetical protein
MDGWCGWRERLTRTNGAECCICILYRTIPNRGVVRARARCVVNNRTTRRPRARTAVGCIRVPILKRRRFIVRSSRLEALL